MFDNSSIHFVFFLHSLSKSTKMAAVSLPVISLSDEILSMSSLNSTFFSTNFFWESGLRRKCNCLMFSGCSKSSEYTFRTVWGIFSYFRAVITCSKSTRGKWGYYNIRTTHIMLWAYWSRRSLAHRYFSEPYRRFPTCPGWGWRLSDPAGSPWTARLPSLSTLSGPPVCHL